MSQSRLWSLLDTEREKLAHELSHLTQEQWLAPSLCESWNVRDVVAHLAAAGSTGTVAWLGNMVTSRFDTDRHNARLAARYLGANYRETMQNFERTLANRIAPLGAAAGLLSEVIVHGQDIAQPLGIDLEPSRSAVLEVASFMASKDFAVKSKTLVKDLKLVASDYPFSVGDGPVVHGKLLDLVMVIAGRQSYLERVSGEGVLEVRERLLTD